MAWPRDPNCPPPPPTSCDVLGCIPTTLDSGARECCLCGKAAS